MRPHRIEEFVTVFLNVTQRLAVIASFFFLKLIGAAGGVNGGVTSCEEAVKSQKKNVGLPRYYETTMLKENQESVGVTPLQQKLSCPLQERMMSHDSEFETELSQILDEDA